MQKFSTPPQWRHLSFQRQLRSPIGRTSNNVSVLLKWFTRVWIGSWISIIPAWAAETGPSSQNRLDQTSARSEFVRIEPGTFLQGSVDSETGRERDEVLHQVQITRPFLIGRTEVTNSQMFKTLESGLKREVIAIGAGKTIFMPIDGGPNWTLVNLQHSELTVTDGHLGVELGMDDYPCTGVTWYGAIIYAHLRSIDAGLSPAIDLANLTCDFSASGFRLLTESEWEYACRAKSTGRFGLVESATWLEGQNVKGIAISEADKFAWFGGNSTGKNKRSHPVACKIPNVWGLYDMHGNVSEWCWDWYGPYSTTPEDNPSGPESGWRRIVRGGDHIREAKRIRSAKRGTGLPFIEHQTRGFRIAQTITSTQEK